MFYIEELGSMLVIQGDRSMTHNSYIKELKVLSISYPLQVNFRDPEDNPLSA